MTNQADTAQQNDGRLNDSRRGKRDLANGRPYYLDIDQACELLAEMNIHLSRRQMKRSSETDAQGKRKLPWFIDPIESRLKIERNALLSAYFNRQIEAERSCETDL